MCTTKLPLLFLGIITSASLFFGSCESENEENLLGGIACDTTNITYNNSIATLLNNKGCVTCHNTNFASGGVNLDSYSQAKQYADNGKLFGSVNHENGFSPMPEGGSKLSTCELNKIKAWINRGSPEN